MARTPHHNAARTQTEIPGTTPPSAEVETSPVWGTWRPRGWRGGLSPEATYPLGRSAEEKARRRVPLTLDEEVALSNLALLRDCYNTPVWVWELASRYAEIGANEWGCDPFWNPSAVGASLVARVKLDGHSPERDGLAVTDEGRPRHWQGPALVNGPHSDPAAWVRLCAAHGEREVVAAVVPCDGVRWYREIALTCDLEVALGRLNYEAPPGMPPANASPRASSLLLWIPHRRAEIKEGRLGLPLAFRVEHAPRRPVVIVRRGFGGEVLINSWI